jgi:GNAT superfamily N-acetyltransferase
LEERPGYLLVENLAVDPSRQGEGVGTGLLTFAEQQALAAWPGELRLYTNERMVENLAYYPRRGFTETHRAHADGFDRLFFTKTLR